MKVNNDTITAITIFTSFDTHNQITYAFDEFKEVNTSRNARMQFAESVVEDWLTTLGVIPPVGILDRLATLILLDEISDDNPYKVSHNERPILSDRQIERREERERKAGVIEYGNERCVGRKKTHFTDDYGAPQVRNSKVYAKL